MQDNSETLTIKSTLTKLGKKRSAEGRLDISKVAFSDDGINYNLINDNLSDDSLLVKRQPLFDVWGDAFSVLKNKILINKPENWQPNNGTFGTSIDRIGDSQFTRVQGKGQLEIPIEDSTNGFKDIKYYGTDNTELSRKMDITLEFSFSEAFGNINNGRYITITLFDLSYFDIVLTPDNIAKFSILPQPSQIPQLRSTSSAKKLLNDSWNRVVHDLLRGEQATTNVTNQHILSRNNREALMFKLSEKERTPKVVNVFLTPDDEGNNMFLRYRGNYNYKNPQIGNYQTFLSIMDERTGQTEYIKLSIIPENKPSN